MRNAAKKRGIVLSSLSRQISLEDFKSFDLILTMDSENYSAGTNLSTQGKKGLIAKIKPFLSYSTSTNLLDVPDPYSGGEEGFEKVVDLLEDASAGLISEIIS